MSIRLRLTILYSGILALTLIAMGIGIYAAVSRVTFAAACDAVSTEARSVANTLQPHLNADQTNNTDQTNAVSPDPQPGQSSSGTPPDQRQGRSSEATPSSRSNDASPGICARFFRAAIGCSGTERDPDPSDHGHRSVPFP